MLYKITINNYSLGARLRMTPTDKIVSQERISPKATVITYDLRTKGEVEFIEKVFARKMTPCDESYKICMDER